MEFVSSVLDRLLSWPVLVIVIVLLFRSQIAGLIGRIRSYEGLGQKIDFGVQLAGAENSVDQAVGDIDASNESVETSAVPSITNPLALEAEANPSFVIISAWERLAGAVADLVGAAAEPARGRESRAPYLRLSELERRQIVNQNYVNAVQEMRSLRNQVAHGQHNPTPGEAVAYAESTEELVRAAHVLAGQYEARRQAEDRRTRQQSPP